MKALIGRIKEKKKFKNNNFNNKKSSFDPKQIDLEKGTLFEFSSLYTHYINNKESMILKTPQKNTVRGLEYSHDLSERLLDILKKDRFSNDYSNKVMK